MASNENEVAGCVVGLWQAIVSLPLWLAVMIGVLITINPPTWVWVCAILYIPSTLISVFLGFLVRLLLD